MKTIILLGELGKRYGRKHMLDVKSPAEAVRALCANFKDFAAFVSASADRNVGYRVLNKREEVGEDELHNPASQRITIAPVVAGAGGTVGKILLGAALIAASFLVPGLAAVTLFGSTTLATVAFSVGVSLALGGIAQMLAPQPKFDGPQEEQQPSYVFNGAVNTTAQGQPVPVGYGRMIVGSAVISAGISVEDIEA
jgi:predicted phage tail protein